MRYGPGRPSYAERWSQEYALRARPIVDTWMREGQTAARIQFDRTVYYDRRYRHWWQQKLLWAAVLRGVKLD